MEKMRGRAINKDTKGWRRDAGHDPGSEYVQETQVDKKHFDINLANPVKRFCQINLEDDPR